MVTEKSREKPKPDPWAEYKNGILCIHYYDEGAHLDIPDLYKVSLGHSFQIHDSEIAERIVFLINNKPPSYEEPPRTKAVEFKFQGDECVIMLKSEFESLIEAMLMYYAKLISVAGNAKMVISFDDLEKMIDKEDEEKKDE